MPQPFHFTITNERIETSDVVIDVAILTIRTDPGDSHDCGNTVAQEADSVFVDEFEINIIDEGFMDYTTGDALSWVWRQLRKISLLARILKPHPPNATRRFQDTAAEVLGNLQHLNLAGRYSDLYDVRISEVSLTSIASDGKRTWVVVDCECV